MEFGPLRQHILQLAISGQLVEQRDSDPEVEQVGPAPKPDEVPFELPPKWKWVQLNCLGVMQTGKTPPTKHSEYFGDDIPFITPGDIDELCHMSYTNRGVSLEAKKVIKTVPTGAVLMVCIGTVGKCGLAKQEVAFNQQINAITPNEVVVIPNFLLIALASPCCQVQVKLKAKATTIPIVNKTEWGSLWLPLPPIEEQRRIVAVVDELMGRLDQMEAAYSEFAGPMTEHFRNLMLDKAIRGELVPQLDSEPEVEQVGLAPKPEEVPFELPPKWKWVPIKALFSMHSGKFIKAALVLDEGTYPCYGGNGIRGYTESFNTEGVCNIIGRVGAQCGNVHLAKGKYYVTDNAIVATHCDRIDPMCANLFLKALNLKQYATATAQPLLNVSTIGKLYYPLAPIEEQRRIVAELEEVFAGVEKLGSLMEYA